MSHKTNAVHRFGGWLLCITATIGNLAESTKTALVMTHSLSTLAEGGLMMGDFRRGIKNIDFLKSLERLAEQESWWRDVVTDPSLIIAVRDEYLNVYWQGQSIFRVTFFNDQVSASTHPKYLLNRISQDRFR